MAEVELHEEVARWLLELVEDEWDRSVVVIDRLAELGPAARMPLSGALGDGLFELRFALGPTARRITYRFTKDGRVVLLTTFRKQPRTNGERSNGPDRPPPSALGATHDEGDDDGELLPVG